MNTSRKFARWSQLAALLTTALFVFVLLVPSTALAAACASAQSGNWNDNATWSNCGGGTPTATDDVTIQNGHTITVTAAAAANDLTIQNGGALALASDLEIAHVWMLQTGGTFNANGYRVTFNGSSYGPYIQGETTFDKLTIQTSPWSTSIIDNITVNLELALDTYAYAYPAIVTLGPNAVTVGTGYLEGTVRRAHTFTLGQTYTFGTVNDQITFTSGTPPTSIELSSTSGYPTTFPNAVYRHYELAATGGSGYVATVRLSYRDWELNGDENNFELYRYNGSSWDNLGQSNRNTTDNWVEQTGITLFSPWAISASAPPPTCYATITGDWNDPATWQNCNGGVPTSTRDVQLNSTVTVTSPAVARNVNGYGSLLNLQSDLDVYGDFNSGGGSLNASAGTVTLKGSAPQTVTGYGFFNLTLDNAAGATFQGSVNNVLTLTTGTFLVQSLTFSNPIAGTPTLMENDPGGGVITISGTASGVNLPSSVSELYYFYLDNPNGTTLQAPLTVSGLMALQQGVLNNTTYGLTVGSGAEIQRHAGSLTAAPTFGGVVNVRYFNSVPITASYELPTASGVLNNLDTYGEKVTLNGEVSVSGYLNLYADIDAGSFIVTLEPTVYAGGTADVIGTVRRPGPFSLSTTYSFGSYYNSLTFTNGTPPDSIDFTLTKAAPGTFPTAVTRTYLITPTGGSGYKATVRLRYNDADLNGNDKETLKLFRYDTIPSAHWQNMGGVSEIYSNYVEQTDIQQFSPWTMSSSAPTAATLTAFTARANKKARVRVKWETGRELDIVGFNVWRKKGSGEFIRLNTELIPAQNVGGIGGARYKFNAGKNKSDKTISYKLEIVKADGTSEWSEVVKVKGK